MESFLQTLRGLGPARLAGIGAAVLLTIGAIIYFAGSWSTPTMSLLYSDLSPSDGGAIIQQLETQKIPYKASADGTRIEVQADQVGRLRMTLAQQGLPSGGNVGNEIFNQPEGLGTTAFMQNVQQLRAKEGELVRSIQTLQPVMNARVHLVLPKRELFARQAQTPTAGVVLKLRPGTQLSKDQVLAIQTLVAAAVPQMDPSNVSIIDDKGKLLSRSAKANTPEAMAASAEERRLAREQELTATIEELLGRSVGHGKVQARVSVEMDFDRITTNSEVYDPDGQVVRGTQSVSENSESQNKDGVDPVTVAANLPNGDAASNAAGGSSEKKNRTEETTNYEISKTTKVHERETGLVRRLSVAVLVDGNYTTAEDGTKTYQPRSEAELAQLQRLVQSAVGVDPARGDMVEVVNMQFARPDDELAGLNETILGIPKEDVLRIAEMLIMAIVAILVILLVIKPMITRVLDRTPQLEEEPDLLSDGSGVPQLAGPGGGALARELAMEAAQANEELEQMIDINRVDGRVRASSLRKVGEIVEKHPEEAVSIIRNWLYQES
ncbi:MULTISPECIES: flagellar basal-body MS-ring/collar protein FliF [unclassified Azospirillum]|uniref:flagellar basal-body MS-ring/collar protein FliF n=1 Tax=unclassified Azospirillum TaxID=2630922 RepID=UPI000B6A84DD|nr:MULTISPECIES: flagellar basal-body MS-ring/collar protein FliF [unclassified Azospirillum]SNS89242.1 flagellar M-ring protein FliF [Azospirillum sp. RU38E]SNT06446.1 flagellar M-ring protein FliF [Azospirillum sp. RU37A]